jgi:hypothetical protein
VKIVKFGSMSVQSDETGELGLSINQCDFVMETQDESLSMAQREQAAAVEVLLYVAACCGAPLIETILMRYSASPSGRVH